MPTPNYGYEKRQRELAKKQKKEQKLREKAERKNAEGQPPQEGDADQQVGDNAESGSEPAQS